MECFLCRRDESQVLLIKLPFETIFRKARLEILGNITDNEFICLPCMGYQIDDMLRRLDKKR